MLDGGVTLLKALPQDLRHLKQGSSFPSEAQTFTQSSSNNPFFFWCEEKMPSIHTTAGLASQPASNANCIGNLSPLHVYLNSPPINHEEQIISNYAQAVRNVVQHPIWKIALYDILQVDKLVTPGTPWFLNNHAVITPFPPVTPSSIPPPTSTSIPTTGAAETSDTVAIPTASGSLPLPEPSNDEAARDSTPSSLPPGPPTTTNPSEAPSTTNLSENEDAPQDSTLHHKRLLKRVRRQTIHSDSEEDEEDDEDLPSKKKQKESDISSSSEKEQADEEEDQLQNEEQSSQVSQLFVLCF